MATSDSPVAEMWFGAHTSAPSVLESGQGLDEVIEEAPERFLGRSVVDSFGPRLPFLMKLLAAAEPLSLQVHPTSERARIRYAEQNAAGVPLDSTERSYPDASHKPELVYALTRFEGMAGFRDQAKSAQILRMFGVDWLDAIAGVLSETTTPFQTLRDLVGHLLDMTGRDLRDRLQELHVAARAAEARSHRPHARLRPPDVERESVERESVRVFAQTSRLIERYPEDPGVLVTLLLNHVVLAAGEAMFVDAGVMHAYTSGFGVEIMASSDNVLRAGLTPKHVDVDEMMQITNFAPMPPPRWEGTRLREVTGVVLSPPVEEFELVIATVAVGERLTEPPGPAIVLCLEGQVTVATGTCDEALVPGESVFVEASEGVSSIAGQGRVALARTPLQAAGSQSVSHAAS